MVDPLKSRSLPVAGFGFYLATFFLLSACGAGSEVVGEGQGGGGLPATKRWVGQEITRLKGGAGILTPRVEARPGSAGDVHLSWFDGNSPRYELNHLLFNIETPLSAKKSVVTTVDNSSGLSLAVDSQGFPVLAYQGGDVRDSGSPSQSDAMFSFGDPPWSEYTAGIGFVERNSVFWNGLAGSHLSVTFDTKGDIHMVYQFRYEGIDALNYANPDLLYIKKVRGALAERVSEETVEGNVFNANGTAGAQNNAGSFAVIAMDSNDLPVSLYYYEHFTGLKGLKVAYRENGEWVSGWVERGVEIGGISRPRLDRDGKLTVAYFVKESQNGEKNFLRYARQEAPFLWAIETVEDSIYAGRYPALSLDASGNPAIAYYSEMSYTERKLNNLRFSRFNGVTWEHENVVTDGDTGLYNSLWFNEEGAPVIITYWKSESSIMMYTGLP